MKKYILLSVTSILLGLSSCDAFLTTTPNDSPTRDVFWKTEADVSAGTNGMYWLFRDVMMAGSGSRIITYGDQPTGLWSNLSHINQSPSQGSYQYTFTDEFFTDWSQYYKVLNVTNTIISATPDIPLSEFGENDTEAGKARNTYIGEALFVRAYTYFFMVRLWGEVPYLTTAVSDAAETVRDVPMENEENILKNCLADLQLAYDYLTFEDTHGSKATKANRGAVLALKAHILMWKNRKNQSTLDPQNYRDAITAINEIETSQKYDLQEMDNYLKIWNGGGKSKETIFEFPYSRGNGEKFDKGSIFSLLLGYPLNTERENESVYKYESWFLNAIDKYTADGDRRRTDCWSRWGEEKFQYTTKYSSITYLDVEKLNWEMDNVFVLFRLSDMYLLRAEAHNELKEYGMARTYLKKTQDRAGIPASVTEAVPDDKLGNEISEERVRELYLEGHNLYDWVRSGQYVGRNGYSADRYNKGGYLWPVNSSLIIDNQYARQTPYWSDKMQ